jgi:hypothetical protein
MLPFRFGDRETLTPHVDQTAARRSHRTRVEGELAARDIHHLPADEDEVAIGADVEVTRPSHRVALVDDCFAVTIESAGAMQIRRQRAGCDPGCRIFLDADRDTAEHARRQVGTLARRAHQIDDTRRRMRGEVRREAKRRRAVKRCFVFDRHDQNGYADRKHSKVEVVGPIVDLEPNRAVHEVGSFAIHTK